MFMSYEDAAAKLNNRGLHSFASIIATHLTKGDNGEIHLVYHGTILVTYHMDNTFSLFSGGFKTKTTKARLCQFAPGSVVQSAGEWFVFSRDGESVGFFEGIRIDALGEEVNPQDYEELNPGWDLHEATIDNQIRKMFLS